MLQQAFSNCAEMKLWMFCGVFCGVDDEELPEGEVVNREFSPGSLHSVATASVNVRVLVRFVCSVGRCFIDK